MNLSGNKLYRSERDAVTAEAVLEESKIFETQQPPILLVYTPKRCGFAKFDQNITFLTSMDPASDIFEFRCFCEDYELRWARTGDDKKGRAVLISEKPDALPGFSEPLSCESGHDSLFCRDDQYLLWGKTGQNNRDELFDHRVGSLRLPVKVNKDRACLSFREYFTQDEYGNLVWETERLLGLKEYVSEK
jgi:CRISPR-associated protein (TIGR03984 family)